MHDLHVEQVRIDEAVAWWDRRNANRWDKAASAMSEQINAAFRIIAPAARAACVTVEECAAALSLIHETTKQQLPKFKCAMCNETFECAWTDKEARAEAAEKGIDPETSGQVCDDCYAKTPWGRMEASDA